MSTTRRAVATRTISYSMEGTVDPSVSSREALKQAFMTVILFRTGTRAARDWQRGQKMAPVRRGE